MSQNDQAQERTESATPRRREQARRKGQVARSREVGTAVGMPACVLAVLWLAPGWLDDFRQLGVGMVLYANASLQGAINGMRNALTHLRDHGVLTENDGLVATFAERQRLVGMSEFKHFEARYAVPDDK